MPSRAPHASRRAVLTGGGIASAALVAATMAGCGSARSDENGPAGAADPTAPAVDADSDLLAGVSKQLTSALSLALATGTSVPSLRALARRWSSLHRAHLDELSEPDEADSGKVRGSVETARARLLRSEEKLQRQLVKAALEAESGALAQVFASMAAAVAQERALAS